MEKRYNLNQRSLDKLKDVIRRVDGGKVSRRPTPTRRAPRMGGVGGNIIIASVNEPTGVIGADTTFSFDGAASIVGRAPTDGEGTAVNLYQQTYSNNDAVLLFQDRASGDWYTERGGSAGSIVVTFELTQDMAYADTAKLAKPVDETGAIISAADAFYVLDEQEKFYGKSGYQGVALKTKNDHSGGVPGYRIITMEGPAQLMTGVLAGSYSTSGTSFTPSVDEIWGRPHRGRREPAEGSITVYDDLDVASDAKTDDKWLIGWDESEEHYIFIVPLKPTLPHVGLHFGMVTSDIAAASMDGTLHTCTPGIQSGAVVLLQWNSGRTALEPMLDADDDELIVKGVNLRKTAFRAGTSQPIVALGQVYGDISNATDALNAHFVLPQDDLRSLPNFDPDATQFPGFLDSDTDAAKLETLEYWLKELGGWTAGNMQSIGHDDSTDPAWQDDDDECPA